MSCTTNWMKRFLSSVAVIVLAFASVSCVAADPKIFPVELSSVDISSQIDREPQGGGKLLPLRKHNYQSLYKMVRKGLGSALLADGADPNLMSPDGEPILFFVLWHRQLDELEGFLKAGADPNRKDQNGNHPLHNAVWNGDVEAVKLLLQYGADPNAECGGQTAIEMARIHRKELVAVLEANDLPRLKPKRASPPEFIRQPDRVFGSELFRPAIGGEAITYSNDSRQVISGGDDGAIRFFDATSGEVKNVIAAHDDDIAELARIPGTEILVSSGDLETKFWDTKTSCELIRLKRSGRGLSVSPNGKWVFTGVHLWQIESWAPLKLSAKGRGYPQAGGKVQISWTFFTPDNRYLIFGVQDGYVYVWNLGTDFVRRIGNLKTTEMRSLKWGDLRGIVDIGSESPNDLLALATNQYTVLAGPSSDLKAFQPLVGTATKSARALATSPDGRYLAAIGYASRIDTFERSGKQLPLQGHTCGLQAVAASPDGNLIASGGGDSVRIWDRKTGQEIDSIKTEAEIYSLCFSPNGKLLAIGDDADGVYRYNLAARELTKWRGRGRITRLQFDSTSEVLIVLGIDLSIFDANTGVKLASTYSYRSSQGLFVWADGLIIGSTNGMAANETFSVPQAWAFRDNQLAVRTDLFSEAMGHRSNIHGLAISADGSTLAAESNFTIRLWDLKRRQPVGTRMVGHTYSVEDMAFSPDGKILASGGGGFYDGTTRIWDVESGSPLLVLDADVNRVQSVAFLPDGCLINATWNGSVHLWDIPKHLEAR